MFLNSAILWANIAKRHFLCAVELDLNQRHSGLQPNALPD